MAGIFLNADILQNKKVEEAYKYEIQYHSIEFYFPEGFTQLRLIEECRALNCLDVSDPDNFDMMYDITMQMLIGKPVFIYFVDDNGNKHEIEKFVVTDRYMNMRGVPLVDEYPILVNWLVEWIAGYLGKKFPRSLKSIQAVMSEKEEHLKSLKKGQEVKIKTSFQVK